MNGPRHYRVQHQAGRWLVVYPLAGQPGAMAVHADCPTEAAAQRLADSAEAERAERRRAVAAEVALLRRRAPAYCDARGGL